MSATFLSLLTKTSAKLRWTSQIDKMDSSLPWFTKQFVNEILYWQNFRRKSSWTSPNPWKMDSTPSFTQTREHRSKSCPENRQNFVLNLGSTVSSCISKHVARKLDRICPYFIDSPQQYRQCFALFFGNNDIEANIQILFQKQAAQLPRKYHQEKILRTFFTSSEKLSQSTLLSQ